MRTLPACVLCLGLCLGLAAQLLSEDAGPTHDEALRTLLKALAAAPPEKQISLLRPLAEWLAPPAGAPANAMTPFAALDILDGQVNNGGFEQYFSNGSGSDWKAALEALEMIKDQLEAKTFKAIADSFGTGGPSTDNAQRTAQVAKMSDQLLAMWGLVDKQWYRHAEERKRALQRWYVAEEAHLVFRPKATRLLTFHGECLMSDAYGKTWGEGLQAVIEKDPRCRLSGWMGSDFKLESMVEGSLGTPSDVLQLVCLPAADPNLRAFLAGFAQLAPVTSIQCVVVGHLPAGIAPPPCDWCLLLEDMGPDNAQALQQVLDRRLLAAPAGK